MRAEKGAEVAGQEGAGLLDGGLGQGSEGVGEGAGFEERERHQLAHGGGEEDEVGVVELPHALLHERGDVGGVLGEIKVPIEAEADGQISTRVSEKE